MANDEKNGSTTVAKVKNDITNMVLSRVNDMVGTGAIKMPEGYAHENAVRSAFLILQDMKKDNKPVLEVCTKASIANSILRMTIQGLNPYKHHGAFIVYGNKLIFQEEYAGWKALAKRYAGVQKIYHVVVYEGDEFEYEIIDGCKIVTKHVQKVENIDMNKIKYAYATAVFEDGSKESEIMTITQIKSSWQMGATKGQSPAHKNFPDKMSEKTVCNRLCRKLVNASDDGDTFAHYEDNDDDKTTIEIESNDVQDISFDDDIQEVAEEVVEEKETKKTEPKEEEKPTETKTPKDSKPSATNQPNLDF